MKGTKITLFATSICATLSIFTTSYATPSAPTGWYLEADAGQSRLSGKSYPATTSNNSTGFAWGAALGYKFMPFFATEANYTRYADTRVAIAGVPKMATDAHYSYALAAKAILPIATSGFELFGKLGIARSNSNVTINNTAAASSVGLVGGSHNATGLYLAVGGQFSFIPEFAINLQAARARGNKATGDSTAYTAGIAFLFS